MGTCCEAHLIQKINEYLPLSANKEVFVGKCEFPAGLKGKCDYCDAEPIYYVGYYV